MKVSKFAVGAIHIHWGVGGVLFSPKNLYSFYLLRGCAHDVCVPAVFRSAVHYSIPVCYVLIVVFLVGGGN